MKLKPPFYCILHRALRRFGEQTGLAHPICPLCHNIMFIRASYLQRNPWRDDQRWKCPKCKLTLLFGIPTTKKEATDDHSLRNGYCWDFVANAHNVKERLKALGYLEW